MLYVVDFTQQKLMTKFHITVNTHWVLITAKNQKQTNTGGLEKLLKLKIGAKVMLTLNVDMQDRLIIGQTEYVKCIEFAQGSVGKV